MIWVIANKKEDDGTNTFQSYKRAFAEGEINIYWASENDDFSFIKEGDVIIIRTRDIETIKKLRATKKIIDFKDTIESELTSILSFDKDKVKDVLAENNIKHPRKLKEEEVIDDNKAFVKPRFGEDSIGICEKSICKNADEVRERCEYLSSIGIEPIIEEYIEGIDLTVAVVKCNYKIETYAIQTVDDSGNSIQSDKTKKTFGFSAIMETSESLNNIAKNVFEAIGAECYMRIDFRMKGGDFYVIDINLIAGLDKDGYMSKCAENHGVEYCDLIRKIVNTAR